MVINYIIDPSPIYPSGDLWPIGAATMRCLQAAGILPLETGNRNQDVAKSHLTNLLIKNGMM
jgi:hypothetical protein